ncbi:MAG TPA: OmpA family protein [Stellaceae bacterium]|nr:OmpA family protein [Stellaceae bacterium]
MKRLRPLALAALLAACASGNEIVLLPNPDGSPSAVVVSNAGGTAVLDRPNAALAVARQSSAPEPVTLSEAEIQRRWADAIAYQPPRPVTLILYFVLDTTELTPASKAMLPQVLDLIRQRPAPEVDIIGHTDRSGDRRYNEELGLRRAEAVRRQIEAIGVPPDLITVTSQGAGNPLVVPSRPYEPRNRRVEITVR